MEEVLNDEVVEKKSRRPTAEKKAEPPLDEGTLQVTVTECSPPVARIPRGTDGTDAAASTGMATARVATAMAADPANRNRRDFIVLQWQLTFIKQ